MVRSYARIFNNVRPVYDGKKNMYTRDPLPIGKDKVRGAPARGLARAQGRTALSGAISHGDRGGGAGAESPDGGRRERSAMRRWSWR